MKKEVYFSGIIIILIALSFYFDVRIVQYFSKIHNYLLDDLFFGITFVSSEIIIFFFLTSLFISKKRREWIFPLWFTLIVTIVISYLLKIIFQRKRPFQVGIVELTPLLNSSVYGLWNSSFPSFQSMMAFASIPILSKEFPKLKYVWISFAFLVAISRVYFGVHFMSDVLIGGCIGYLIGLAILIFEDKNKFFGRIYRKISKK